MYKASDSTPVESSLTGKDQVAGIPAGRSKALKFVQVRDFTDVARLISGAYIRALLIRHAGWVRGHLILSNMIGCIAVRPSANLQIVIPSHSKIIKSESD